MEVVLLFLRQIAEMIRHVIDAHTDAIPSVLEIPSKDSPYDASKDSILRRARVGGVDVGLVKRARVVFTLDQLGVGMWS